MPGKRKRDIDDILDSERRRAHPRRGVVAPVKVLSLIKPEKPSLMKKASSEEYASDDYTYSDDNSEEGEYGCYEYESGEEETKDFEADSKSPLIMGREVSYEIMNSEQLNVVQEKIIAEVVETLGISGLIAREMLRRTDFNKDRCVEKWFDDPDAVRKYNN